MLHLWCTSKAKGGPRPQRKTSGSPDEKGLALPHTSDARPVRDALLAATALVHDLTLVTRNVSDFEPAGVEVLDLWN